MFQEKEYELSEVFNNKSKTPRGYEILSMTEVNRFGYEIDEKDADNSIKAFVPVNEEVKKKAVKKEEVEKKKVQEENKVEEEVKKEKKVKEILSHLIFPFKKNCLIFLSNRR